MALVRRATLRKGLTASPAAQLLRKEQPAALFRTTESPKSSRLLFSEPRNPQRAAGCSISENSLQKEQPAARQLKILSTRSSRLLSILKILLQKSSRLLFSAKSFCPRAAGCSFRQNRFAR